MPLTKITMLFKCPTQFGTGTNARINQLFGWSENFYLNNDKVTDTSTRVFTEGLINARCALLADEAWCYGYRIQRVDPTGASRKFTYYREGGAGEANDDPCNCLIYNVRGAEARTNRREVILRGLPDARLEKGEFKPTAEYRRRLRAYFQSLKDGEFGFRGIDKTQETVKIKSIEAGRLVHLEEATTMIAGNDVQVLRSLAAGHRFKGVKTKIFSVDDTKTLLLEDWPFGASKGGRLRKSVTPIHIKMELTETEIDNPEVSNRDTGVPGDQPRGRQSAKYV